MGSILGGGGGKSSSSQVSGYSALPGTLQNAFNPLGQAVGQYTNPNNSGVTDRFTPLQQTQDETQAYNQLRQGFAPTQQSLNSDISMLMNPYDNFVENGINRAADSQFSILKQAQNAAGQLGSNRGMLGANDIEQTRLNTIGQFKQGQYNNAISQVFNNLIPLRQGDTSGMLGIADRMRGLDYQTQQAPISALQAGTSMISPFTSGGTSTQTQSSGGSGMLGGIGQLASGVGGLLPSSFNAGAFLTGLPWSDVRLKENIQHIGEANGIPLYHFNYIGYPERYEGVMAQDVIEIVPDAVVRRGEYFAVNYENLGITFKRVDQNIGPVH